jgi:hypothetical protein
MDTTIKALLIVSLLGLGGCASDIAVRPSVGVSFGPDYSRDFGGGGYYGPRWGRWHRRGWW